ncbi:MAG: LPP20 family lipoprotein [Treponema sp.]|nr:LPP20 family lipoprotein [Treponema sp.]
MVRIKQYVIGMLLLSVGSSISAWGKKDATRSPAPQWVTNPTSVYPADAYVVAIGSGAERSSAELSALAGIAAVFGQTLTVTAQATDSIARTSDTDTAVYTRDQRVTHLVDRTVAQDDVLGVSVPEFWFDGAGTWYALALINRAETAALYEARIIDNNREITALTERDEDNPYTFRAYARYGYAVSLGAYNDTALARLSVIDKERSARLRETSRSAVSLRHEQVELAHRIPVALRISNDPDGTVAAVCAEIFSHAGFLTVSERAGHYLFAADVVLDTAPNSTGTIVYCRYVVTGYLTEIHSREQLLPVTVRGRQGAATQAEAERRALAELKRALPDEFGVQFTEYLDRVVAAE